MIPTKTNFPQYKHFLRYHLILSVLISFPVLYVFLAAEIKLFSICLFVAGLVFGYWGANTQILLREQEWEAFAKGGIRNFWRFKIGKRLLTILLIFGFIPFALWLSAVAKFVSSTGPTSEQNPILAYYHYYLISSALTWFFTNYNWARSMPQKVPEPGVYRRKNKRISLTFLCGFTLAIILRASVVQLMQVTSTSMAPTLHAPDRVIVNKFIYHFSKPKRGDIIAFKFPKDPKINFIKRVAATAGEEINIKGGRICIDGNPIAEPEVMKKVYYYSSPDFKKQRVPEDSLFVLGDNSLGSDDSRIWGFLPLSNVKGRISLVYWPPKRAGLVR